MGLAEYARKRNFAQTPEPKGKPRAKGKAARRRGALALVVQKHAASRLHYDFRLEHGGVLLSWAVPKGPSLDPKQRRLAVRVEDHPLEYGSFEGTIPKGEYGGGTVLLWDRGTWEPEGDVDAALRKGHLKFALHGEKLRGVFSLVHIRSKDGDDENWLLIKGQDEFARAPRAKDITVERPESVATGRDLDEIASGKSATWSSGRAKSSQRSAMRAAIAARVRARGNAPSARAERATPAKRKRSAHARRVAKARAGALHPEKLSKARQGRLPDFVEPELATLVRDVPAGSDWIHETKLDGYRAQCRIDHGEVRWLTRNGLDWSARFRALSPAAEALPVESALIDGEIVVLRADGVSDFQLLQRALRDGAKSDLTYFAFDLLHLDGFDLRASPLVERKALLARLLAGAPAAIRYCDHVASRGPEFHAQACAHALEGIVSKRASSPYRSERGRDWRKIKCTQRQELVVGGWTEPKRSRSEFGALLLGYHDAHGELRHAGRVGTGFDAKALKDVLRRLKETKRSPFVDPPRGAEARGVHWAKPETVIEVEFTGWTSDGKLRHASFEGVREDKAARDVVRERPADLGQRGRVVHARRKVAAKSARSASSKPRASIRRAAQQADAEIAGVRISHPDRVLFPEQGLTKLDLARYYERVEDKILPHVARRPVSFVRCPEGASGECFFQRHPSPGFPDSLHGIRDRESGRTYVWIDSLAGLVGLVQMGALEIHPWGSRVDDLEKPDRLFFDLDPDSAIPWARVKDAARLVRDLLAEVGLESFVKTTGGKGLHVVVPLARRHDWETVKGFAQGVARTIERAAPDRFLSKASKSARKGKIFVDWLRNARTATAVAAYSTRAKRWATVSMPVSWTELEKVAKPDAFTVTDRARRTREPWPAFAKLEQTITAKARKAVGA